MQSCCYSSATRPKFILPPPRNQRFCPGTEETDLESFNDAASRGHFLTNGYRIPDSTKVNIRSVNVKSLSFFVDVWTWSSVKLPPALRRDNYVATVHHALSTNTWKVVGAYAFICIFTDDAVLRSDLQAAFDSARRTLVLNRAAKAIF